MQDFTGVPAVVDLAAMREAMIKLGGNPDEINPLSPAELVIDHSVQVDAYGAADSLAKNTAIEFGRNTERYAFLRWGQTAFRNFKVVPPNTGIVHQVNIEHLARVVFDMEKDGVRWAYPGHAGRHRLAHHDGQRPGRAGLGRRRHRSRSGDARPAGDDAHSARHRLQAHRAACRAGTTATDLVLTVTEMLRKKGVVDKFVEFFGDGLANLPLADRATIANMSPEFGSTCAIFPIDDETLRYLRAHRPQRRAHRDGEGLCAAPGHVARERPAAGRLHRRARARPRHGRAVARRPEAPAGSRAAAHREADVSDHPQEDGRGARDEESRRDRLGAVRPSAGKSFEVSGRRGADRRDHELHQHIESRRADRRRPARPQCAQPRPDVRSPG